MDISKAWGYAAVVIPSKLFWQGFVVLDPEREDVKRLAKELLHNFQIATSIKPAWGPDEDRAFLGAMQAVLVDTVPKMPAPGAQAIVAAASSWLAKISGHRFFIVNGKPDEKGIETDLVEIPVQTPDQARDYIERQVQPLKMGLMLQLLK
jgi:hypothetical protein